MPASRRTRFSGAIYPEPDLAAAERRLRLFLIQYWGGPRTYDDERGHPRLRMRHFPFAIGPAERDRWLTTCGPRSRHRRRRTTWPRNSSAISRWPRRRCATASEAPGRPSPGTLAPARRRGRVARGGRLSEEDAPASTGRGKTIHGEAANAGHRVLAPDDAEVEAYLETALKAPAPDRSSADRPASADPDDRETVVVLDFGSQFAQLIARRVRELDVYSELLPHDTPYAELERRGARAIILSGSPNSVYDAGAPRPDPAIWSGRIPVLGICYGAQLMAHELGGDVIPFDHREYGPANVSITATDEPLFAGIEREQPVWMSHGDSISRLPEGFQRHGPDRLHAVRRPGRRLAQPVRHPVPPRGRPHPARQGRPAQLRGRHRRGLADLDRRQLHRDDRRRHPRAGRRPRPGDRVGRAGHLRAVGRRRLRGRGGARPSGGRRSADLHLRRPRVDAQEGIGAAAGHLRARPRDAPGDGRCARALPRPAGRRRGPRAEAQDHRRRVHPRLRGGGDQARPDRLPDPGHALPGRHRIRRRPRPRPPRRSRPTTTSVACRPTCASSSSSRCATCSRTRSAGSGSSSACPRRWSSASRSPGRGSRSGSSAR